MAAAGALLAPQAAAIEVGSAACKREMQAAQQMMRESAALVDSGMKASGAERCKALSQHLDLAEKIRESFSRCEGPKNRTSAVRDADEVIEASNQAYNKWCPARPGMVRVRMTMVERVTRDKLRSRSPPYTGAPQTARRCFPPISASISAGSSRSAARATRSRPPLRCSRATRAPTCCAWSRRTSISRATATATIRGG
jgi:hypothetical protein